MDSAQEDTTFKLFPLINLDTKAELLRTAAAAVLFSNERSIWCLFFTNQHTSKSCSRRPEDSNENKLFGQQTCLQTQNALCLILSMFRCFIRNHEDFRATFIAEKAFQLSLMWCFTDFYFVILIDKKNG